MKLRRLTVTLASALLFAGNMAVLPGLAADQAMAATPGIDPAALQAGNRMGAYLRSLQSFEVVSSASLEEVIDENGKKATTQVSTTYKVKRPDGFAIEVTTDKKARKFIYDGRSFTVFAPRVGYFASISAPGTIDQTVDLIYERYGVILPLADLFYWGSAAMPTDMVTSAKRLGPAKIGDVETDHYAYGGPGLSWEVWIQRGDAPLPRRMRITTVDDPAKPTFTADLSWTTAATFPADTFTFKPAADAKPIAMTRVDQ